MNSINFYTCKKCGATIPKTSTEQLCPACLLEGLLDDHNDELTVPLPPLAESLLQGKDLDFPLNFGDYRLLRLLGKGGMGVVYEAEDLETGRRVAIKMLCTQIDSPGMQQRFLREGRIAARISHPNSLFIFGSEEIDSLPIISMEIADSGTLADKLKADGPMPVAVAVDAILDIISGLQAAFKDGILHRDIKPSNCFISPDGIKVGDFGLSVSTLPRDDSFMTAGGMILGTPAFASPEQLRGDELDVRSDIYSVGATLYTLLTNRVPFEGKNAVQIVANVLNEKPKLPNGLPFAIPSQLEKTILRCLEKNRAARFADYQSLREALLPFSSGEPEPIPIITRSAAGWIDYLIAFLLPYIPLMLALGNDTFHLRPFLKRTAASYWHFFIVLGFAILYFTLTEGIWGAGVGKRIKGLQVIRNDGKPVGILRAFLKIFLQILSIEGVRIPLLFSTISAATLGEFSSTEVIIFVLATTLCPMIPVLGMLTATQANGYMTVWDWLSGTRVVFKQKGVQRPVLNDKENMHKTLEQAYFLGPFKITGSIVKEHWLCGTDPQLRRAVWAFRQSTAKQSQSRQNISRATRLRWLQTVKAEEAQWHIYRAPSGKSFTEIFKSGKIPWATLRHWLYDIASEFWRDDDTLPSMLSFDHLWITEDGHAIILDQAWPNASPSPMYAVTEICARQHFLSTVAAQADRSTLPLHAQAFIQNLAKGAFEKLSFLTGTLQSLLEKPAHVSAWIRAGSIFLLPLYIWIMLFLGTHQSAEWLLAIAGDSPFAVASFTGIMVLVSSAVMQLFSLPFHSSSGMEIFRLAVIDKNHERAGMRALFIRWAASWLPLLLPLAIFLVPLHLPVRQAIYNMLPIVLVWLACAGSIFISPYQGLHDWIAGTRVVRQ